MNRDDSERANLGRDRERHGDSAISPDRDPNRSMSEPDLERARGDRVANEDEESAKEHARDAENNDVESNPPRTTTGSWFTAPKFGSAGRGGAEFEPPTKKP